MNAPFGRTRVPSPTNLKMCDRTKLNLDSTHELRGCAQTVRSSSKACTTHGLSWCLRGLGLGGFHPVPGTWIVREDLSSVQFELYQGTGWNPPSPWILKHQLSPCVVDNTTRHVYSCICVQDRVVNSCLHRHVLRTKSIVQALHAPLEKVPPLGLFRSLKS